MSYSCSFSMAEAATALVVIQLDDTNVPGALLNEPLESHNTVALRMWLILSWSEGSFPSLQLIER